MKIKELKLYNKYKDKNYPEIELIYIGIDNENDYWFLYKHKDYNLSLARLKLYGLDPDKIVKKLNLDIVIDVNGYKCIEGYNVLWYKKEDIEINFKPILKDKLKNILNR